MIEKREDEGKRERGGVGGGRKREGGRVTDSNIKTYGGKGRSEGERGHPNPRKRDDKRERGG